MKFIRLSCRQIPLGASRYPDGIRQCIDRYLGNAGLKAVPAWQGICRKCVISPPASLVPARSNDTSLARSSWWDTQLCTRLAPRSALDSIQSTIKRSLCSLEYINSPKWTQILSSPWLFRLHAKSTDSKFQGDLSIFSLASQRVCATSKGNSYGGLFSQK